MGTSISGTVTDRLGRRLSKIKVVATHEPTGSLFARWTDDQGRYEFQDIKAGGPYAVTAAGDGLETVQHRLQLKTEEAVECNFMMGEATESLADDESHTSA